MQIRHVGRVIIGKWSAVVANAVPELRDILSG